MDIETPYPVKGTVFIREKSTGWSLPCESEWLSEVEGGSIMDKIDNEMRVHHDPKKGAEFIAHGDGRYQITDVFDKDDDRWRN